MFLNIFFLNYKLNVLFQESDISNSILIKDIISSHD